MPAMAKARCDWDEGSSRFVSWLEHDLLGTSLPTFQDQALDESRTALPDPPSAIALRRIVES
jgi:hypothetical protein